VRRRKLGVMVKKSKIRRPEGTFAKAATLCKFENVKKGGSGVEKGHFWAFLAFSCNRKSISVVFLFIRPFNVRISPTSHDLLLCYFCF
jgi:hypothetical protein